MLKVLFWCTAVMSLASCGHGGVSVDEQSNGKTVALSVGDPLTVTLSSLGDGGYSNWSVTTVPDQTVLRSTSTEHQPGSGAPGDFGKDVFKYEAVAAGPTSLAASAVRSFSGGTQTFALTVTVR